jgi:hypothetical protein
MSTSFFSICRHTMHIFVWIIVFLNLIIVNGKPDACLHNGTKGKHCTPNTQSLLERLLIRPTTSENQECYTLCMQSGYRGGGHCSVSEDCFRFCSCYHPDNSTLSSSNE